MPRNKDFRKPKPDWPNYAEIQRPGRRIDKIPADGLPSDTRSRGPMPHKVEMLTHFHFSIRSNSYPRA